MQHPRLKDGAPDELDTGDWGAICATPWMSDFRDSALFLKQFPRTPSAAGAYLAGGVTDLGQEIPPRDQQTPETLGAYQKAEIEKWRPIAKAANINPH